MYKIVIVEDEFNAQEALSKMLNLLFNQIEIVGIIPSVKEAKVFLEQNEVDLVFFDIELEDGNSIEFLKQLKQINFQIVFTTGFNKYAIEAIRLSAIDYLLKPIDPEELKSATEKAMKQVVMQEEMRKQLDALEDNRNNRIKKIVVKTADNTHFIEIENIIMLESDGAYTKIIEEEKTIMASKHLKYFENLLESSQFIRTHQSFLINPKHIKGVNKLDVLLTNKRVAKIATRKQAEVLSKIKLLENME